MRMNQTLKLSVKKKQKRNESKKKNSEKIKTMIKGQDPNLDYNFGFDIRGA